MVLRSGHLRKPPSEHLSRGCFKNLTKRRRHTSAIPAADRAAQPLFAQTFLSHSGGNDIFAHSGRDTQSHGPNEQANTETRHPKHHIQHHHPPAGHGRYGDSGPAGRRCRRNRRHRHRNDDIQHDILDVRFPAHGNERHHGTGLRSPQPARMYRHPRPFHVRGHRAGPASRSAAQPRGAVLAWADAGQRRGSGTRSRILLRPYLGGTRFHIALRIHGWFIGMQNSKTPMSSPSSPTW